MDNEKFDVNSLPEEARKYIDQQINSGVLTGKKNAEEKLKNDETFKSEIEKSIREKIEAEAKMNAEEKAKAILEEANKKSREAIIRSNISDAKDLFSEAGISKDVYSEFIDVLVDEDSEKTSKKVSSFIDKFKKTVEETTGKELENKLKEMTKPQNPDNSSKAKVDTNLDIKNISFSDLAKLKIEKPEEYEKLINNK